jgi:hypothetical protein
MRLITLLFIFYAGFAFAATPTETAFEKAAADFEAKNYDSALKTLKPLAEKGDAKSQYALGIMYEYGYGMNKDLPKAQAWYLKAATQGNIDAQYNLGVLYEHGTGIKKDYAQAAKWYRAAAAQSDIDAFNNLGFLYQGGLGVTQNKIAALALYNVSVALEKENAQKSQAAKNRQLIANQMPLEDVQKALTLTGSMTQSPKPLDVMDTYLKTAKPVTKP